MIEKDRESERYDKSELTVPILVDGIGTRISAASSLIGGKRKLAEMTDVSESQLHRIIAGDSKAKIDTIVAIAKATDVNIEWLATGEGPMLPGDELAAPAGFDIDLMGQIMAIFMDAAYTQKTAIPAKDIGEMAARAYVDILADFPDPENRQKALRQLATIANNITRLYG